MGKFIVQRRFETAPRDFGEKLKNIMAKSPWENGSVHENIEEAKNVCISAIEEGRFRARNIRVVEVVCEFQSKVIIKEGLYDETGKV